MKVYGQLEKAGLEQLTSDPTPAWPGRMYMNIASLTKAFPKVYNGSSWLQVLTGANATVVSQTASTQSTTVDWSTGTTQQVILGCATNITFVNPQAGQVHQLIVTQGANTGLEPWYGYTLNMPDQDSRRQPYQPVGVLQPYQSTLYSWLYQSGIKTGYATLPYSGILPTSTPGTLCTGSDISVDGKAYVVSSSVSPYQYYYNLYDKGGRYGMGLKNLVTPATGVAALVAMKFSPDLDAIYTASGTTPYINGYFLDRYTGVGTAFSNPATLPAGAAQCLAMHPSGAFVGVGHTTTPFMSFYPISGTSNAASPAFGTKISNPATLPVAQVNAADFSRQGDFLAIASQTTPFIQVYAFTPSITAPAIGAVVTQPSTLPAGGPAGQLGKGIAWRPQGDFIAMAMTTTPYIYVVPFNRTAATYGTPLTITAPTSVTAANAVQWTPDGNYLLVAVNAAPYLLVYDFSSQVIGTAITYDNTTLAIASTVNDIAVTPDGAHAILSMAAGTIQVQALPTKTRNYLRIVD
jgi:hypothetical protein